MSLVAYSLLDSELLMLSTLVPSSKLTSSPFWHLPKKITFASIHHSLSNVSAILLSAEIMSTSLYSIYLYDPAFSESIPKSVNEYFLPLYR